MIEIKCPNCGGTHIVEQMFVLHQRPIEQFGLTGVPTKYGKEQVFRDYSISPEDTSYCNNFATYMCVDCLASWASAEEVKEAGVFRARRDRKSNAYYAKKKEEEQNAKRHSGSGAPAKNRKGKR